MRVFSMAITAWRAKLVTIMCERPRVQRRQLLMGRDQGRTGLHDSRQYGRLARLDDAADELANCAGSAVGDEAQAVGTPPTPEGCRASRQFGELHYRSATGSPFWPRKCASLFPASPETPAPVRRASSRSPAAPPRSPSAVPAPRRASFPVPLGICVMRQRASWPSLRPNEACDRSFGSSRPCETTSVFMFLTVTSTTSFPPPTSCSDQVIFART